ncbi:hypothetical protein Cfor_10207 [Coptotermes formosanus]|jgi:hypothetical protein|uniref:Glomulin n=1 Tax=Coptotermes formosanus TaxID=36987 RepID=A0A6L2PAH3_COPFO|nr:hypothetical protein Cfor_10207 [Coptotermes formosanus]
MSVQGVDDLCNEFISSLSSCLADGRRRDALSIIYNPKYDQCFKDKSWDIIPFVSNFLIQETVDNSPEVFECCETLLREVAKKANPQEALFEFLEQAESLENDVKFLAMIKPLKTVLFELPNRRRQSLEWCLNVIHSHVTSLPVPRNYRLEGEERKLLDSDPDVRRITKIYNGIVPFYEPFVIAVSLRQPAYLVLGQPVDYEIKLQRDMLVRFILQLLSQSLAFLDLEYHGKSRSAIWFVAEELLRFLAYLVGDLMIFLEHAERREAEGRVKRKNNCTTLNGDEDMLSSEDRIPVVSYAVLYYLVLAERMQLKEVPCVYSPLYIFQRCLYLIVLLMKYSQELVIHKGLLLANAVLGMLSDGSVPCDVLESPTHKEFVEALSKVMIYCQVEDFRKSAVFVLRSYLFKFDVKGQYLLMSNLATTINHAGILGYLTMLLKDMIVSTLNSTVMPPYFRGKVLYDLISKYCSLEHGAETDLVENVDQIISALNLIRFLALRDRENRTGMWDYVEFLKKALLEPLREGIKLSRAHYKLKLKDLEEEKKVAMNDKGLSNKSDVIITVGGQQLPNLPHENKVAVIMSALNAFDLMESLLIRVNECIDNGPSKSCTCFISI